MFEITFTTPGGVTLRIVEASGMLRIGAESSSYGPHDAFVTLASDGSNPTVTVQQGANSHVMVTPAGAGDPLYDSAA